MIVEVCGKTYPVEIWNGENLGTLICIDTETEVVPFTETPDIVTFQATDGNVSYYVPIDMIDKFFEINDSNDTVFVFQNFVFDKDVIEKSADFRFFDAVEAGRVRDTKIMYKLVHLAQEGWVPFKSSLKDLALIYLNEEIDKDEEVRLTFAQFKGREISEIPEDHLIYGAKDPIYTFLVYLRLAITINNIDSTTRLSHDIQIKGDCALNRLYKNGIKFNLEAATEKLKELDEEMNLEANKLALYGWVRGQKGIKERYEWIMSSFFGLDLPRTESGVLSSKTEDLLKYKGNPFVDSYIKYHELEKCSSFIREIDSNKVHPRYNLLMNTGRTSCAKPNFQQLPRKGGIRELFVGNFIITDYTAIELATLAQITYKMYGESEMRNRINNGEDLHRYYASILFNKKAENVTDDERQKAKAANFGFPGGLGIETFIEFSRGYGLDLKEWEAREMKKVWFEAFPEMVEYMKNEVGMATTLTGRVRGRTSYCAEKNTPFQGLASDGAKLALWRLMNDSNFKLRGFVHDEIITEVAPGLEDELLPIQEKIMVEEMQKVCPDVRIEVKSQAIDHYCK